MPHGHGEAFGRRRHVLPRTRRAPVGLLPRSAQAPNGMRTEESWTTGHGLLFSTMGSMHACAYVWIYVHT